MYYRTGPGNQRALQGTLPGESCIQCIVHATAGLQAILEKTSSLAETDEAHAHAKHDLKKTREALSADQKSHADFGQHTSGREGAR